MATHIGARYYDVDLLERRRRRGKVFVQARFALQAKRRSRNA